MESHAQFFTGVDKDKLFNGEKIDYVTKLNTKNCTLVEETESYRLWKPSNNEIKTKKFTLKNILYYTNFNDYIWKIEATSNGNSEELERIKNDMASGANDIQEDSGERVKNIIYYHTNTRLIFFWTSIMGNSDKITIILEKHINWTTTNRKEKSFVNEVGQPVKSESARNLFSAHFDPEARKVYSPTDKTYQYFSYGVEVNMRNDTIKTVAVYNESKEYKKYKGPLPYGLALEDDGNGIKSKLGDPFSINRTDNCWYFRKGKLEVSVSFIDSGCKEIYDIYFSQIPTSNDALTIEKNNKQNALLEVSEKAKAEEDYKKWKSPRFDGALPFTDDFSSNKEGWGLEKNENSERAIKDGKYTVNNKMEGNVISTLPTEIRQTYNYSISLTAVHNNGAIDSGYGLVFGNLQGNAYYTFEISADGKYRVTLTTNQSNLNEVVPWTTSEVIKKGNNVENTLTLSKDSASWNFAINKKIVNTIPTQGLAGNGTGVIVRQKQQVNFDNLILKRYYGPIYSPPGRRTGRSRG